MSELRVLVEAARQAREQRAVTLSATVVRVRGSGYRRAGARMLVSADRWLAGSISGGCLERDVVARGLWRTREQRSVLVTYDESEDALDERRGSGCQGVVDVLLERREAHGAAADGGETDWYGIADECLRTETSAAAVTVFHSTRSDVPVGARMYARAGDPTTDNAYLPAMFADEAASALATLAQPYVARHQSAEGVVDVLVERIAPPPHLFVFGSGHDVDPLIALAKPLGWTLSVWDALPRSGTRERLRGADHYLSSGLDDALARLARAVTPVAVVMGHHFDQDCAVLAGLLKSSARYIGVLGPRRRTDEMLSAITAAGTTVEPGALARVYAPVGLQLGAHTPAEVALAIIAEAQAALANARVVALRDETGAIHPRAPGLEHSPRAS